MVEHAHPAIRTVAVRIMCYNEEATIVEVVQRTLALEPTSGFAVAVEVIDDGSQDQSGMLLRREFADHPAVTVHRHKRRLGIGAVLRRAFRATSADAVVLLCGDLQFAPEDTAPLLHQLDKADLAIALRRERQDPGRRSLLTAIDRGLTRTLIGTSYPDVHWVRAVRASFLADCHFVSQSPTVDVELAHHVERRGGIVATLPLPHHPRRFGRSHGAGLASQVRSFVDLLRYAISVRRRR